MTEEMRENIKTSLRSKFQMYAEQLDGHRAYALCLAFGYGVQVGSQDAELINFVNALLEEYRMKLICAEV